MCWRRCAVSSYQDSGNCYRVDSVWRFSCFILAGVLWFFLLGWVIHLWSIIDAAKFKPPQQ